MARGLSMTRGRRLALVIGLPFALASVGWTGLNFVSLVAQAKYKLAPTTLPNGSTLRLSISNGDVAIAASSDGRAHLEGTVNYSLVNARVSWRVVASVVVVSGPSCFWLGNCGSDLHLAVPPEEDLHAHLGSGTLNVEDLDGPLHLSTSSGDIRVSDTSGPLALSDSSGDITGAVLASSTVSASDDSGDIRLAFNRAPTKVEGHDSSGNITVAVPANVAYRVVTHVSSGSSHVDVPTDPASKHFIDLSDDSGDIKVVPAAP